MNRQLFDSRVDFRHMVSELPERIHEEDGIIPSILTRSITGSSGLQLHVLADGRMHGRVLLGPGVWYEGHGEVWMVVRAKLRSVVLLHYFSLIGARQQILRLPDLLLRKDLIQRTGEVVGFR